MLKSWKDFKCYWKTGSTWNPSTVNLDIVKHITKECSIKSLASTFPLECNSILLNKMNILVVTVTLTHYEDNSGREKTISLQQHFLRAILF